MKNEGNKDYTKINKVAQSLGLKKSAKEGFYFIDNGRPFQGGRAFYSIDLTASDDSLLAVATNIINQIK